MTFIVAVANQKGGVAKTTTAANVADAAARRGLRVLLVDLDPQGTASVLTGAIPQLETNRFGRTVEVTVSDALLGALPHEDADELPGTVLGVAVPTGQHWAESLWIAPANDSLAGCGDRTFDGQERRLAIGLEGAAGRYDLVVIDSPPTLGMLPLSALYAADGVLLVTEPADGSVFALAKAMTTIQRVRAARGQDAPQLLGALATMVPPQEGRARELVEHLRSEYGDELWATIPRRSVVRHAEGAQAPVHAFGSDAREVVTAYQHVTDRLLQAAHLAPAGAT